MLARRLLMVGGSGSLASLNASVAVPDTVELIASGGVTGVSKVTPAAFYYLGDVYFGYVDSSGEVEVAAYDVATAITGTPAFVGGPGLEAHAAPSVIVRETDHKVVVGFTRHDGPENYQVEYTLALTGRTSVDLASQTGGSDFTYISQVQLAGESNKLYRFWRDISGGTGRIAYSTSANGGVTWAAATILATPAGGGSQVDYFRVGSDWNTRIDILTTDNDRVVTPSALYHMYYEAGDWHKSDGTVIATAKPFTHTSMTLVKSNADGAIDPLGVSFAGGTPGGVFFVYKPGTPTNEVWTCRYRSGAWQNNLVGDANGILGTHRFITSAAIDETNPDRVWYPKKVGSFFEMHEALSSNDGVTWTVTALESGSSDHAVLPTPVHSGIAGARCIYGKGVYTTPYDETYSLSIRMVT